MKLLLDELLRQADSGSRVALCIVVGSKGSTPQERGAKMLVLPDGKLVGTLGGGCVEAEVKRKALELISANQTQLLDFHLDHDYGWDDGLICGGTMEILVQVIDASQTRDLRELRDALANDRSGTLRLAYTREGACGHYVEELGPPPMLVIAGAGHVSQALAKLARDLDFRVTVIDDRADFASAERFPGAQCIVGEIESELSRFPIDPSTFVVIVTRGHRNDGQALHAVIDSGARYIGLIGSKAKVKTIFSELVSQDVSVEKLLRVHAPIGLQIGSVTVPEIAISVAAELVAVRRGRENVPAKPMKFDEAEMRAWLTRGKR